MIIRTIFIVALISASVSCKKEVAKTISGPVIEWIIPAMGERTHIDHSLDSFPLGSFPSGISFLQKFNVSNESGEITISIQEPFHNLSKTSVFNVTLSKQYQLNVTINYSFEQGQAPYDQCNTFYFSSPNCKTIREFNLYPVRIPTYGPVHPNFLDVCPSPLTIGEVSITQLN